MNKLLLALIAAGLWANAALTFVRPVHADSDYGAEILSELESIKSNISSIKSDTDDISRIQSAVKRMESGTCSNSKIC
jgi:dihydrodipicolinate synthase/N-acetylneuraminate lyase